MNVSHWIWILILKNSVCFDHIVDIPMGGVIQNRPPGRQSKKLDFKLLFLPFWDHFFYFWDHQCFVFRLSFCLIIRFFVHIFRELLSLRDPRLDWSSTSLQQELSLEERGKRGSKASFERGWVSAKVEFPSNTFRTMYLAFSCPPPSPMGKINEAIR